MPATQSVSSAIPLKSNEHRYAVHRCPKCDKRDGMRGPHDGPLNKTAFTFIRTHYCVLCWWRRDMEMLDDSEQARVKHERDEAKKAKRREQARRT